MLSTLRDWAERAGFLSQRNGGHGAVQIGAVHGAVMVVNITTLSPPLDRRDCSQCPRRCCPHNPEARDKL